MEKLLILAETVGCSIRFFLRALPRSHRQRFGFSRAPFRVCSDDIMATSRFWAQGCTAIERSAVEPLVGFSLAFSCLPHKLVSPIIGD